MKYITMDESTEITYEKIKKYPLANFVGPCTIIKNGNMIYGKIVIGEHFGSDWLFLLSNSSELDGRKLSEEVLDGYKYSFVLSSVYDFSSFRLYKGKAKMGKKEKINDGWVEMSEFSKFIIEKTGGGKIVKEYHSKVPIIFHKRKDEPPKRTDFFGVEIEYNWLKGDGDFAHYIGKHQGFFHYEHDGSLDNGIECITQPFSELYYQNRGKDVISELVAHVPDILNPALDSDGDKNGEQNTTNRDTGIHVHISRASLTEEMVCKLFFFINEPSWREKIIKLAGRSPTTYCRLKDNNKVKKIVHAKDINKDHDMHSGGNRYVSVNLENEKTVEIRIFRSSSTVWKVLGRIEFVMALVKYLRLSSGRYWNGVDFDKFVEYVRINQYSYQNLVKLLTECELY